MASGKIHNIGGWIAVTGVSTFTAYLNLFVEDEPVSWFMIAGAMLAHMVDPDVLDQHQIVTNGERRVKKVFGRIPYYIVLTWAWLPAKIIPHRSPLSHWPPINTLFRMALFLSPIVIILAYNGFYLNNMMYIYILLGGLPVDAIHLILDSLSIFREKNGSN